MMTRRKIIGLTMALGASLVGAAGAIAFAAHGRHETIMRRVATAMIHDALDHVGATPEQRAAVQAAGDRVLALVQDHHKRRPARLEELLAAFEADPVDRSRILALRHGIEAEHAQIADAIGQALVEVHGVLTAEQRRLLADHVRAHHPRAH
jgi:Spy/CpxP family protein refolding chaperone